MTSSQQRAMVRMSEKAIQSAVMAHWRAKGVPGSLVAAIPNQRAFGQPGLTRGLPDLIVLSPTLGELTGFLELKADKGTLSDHQEAFAQLCQMRGIPWAVSYGRDEPIAILEQWGAVRL